MKYNRIHSILILFSVFLFSSTIKAQITISSQSATYTENFDGIGNTNTASLPTGWKVSASGGGTSYGTGTAATTTSAGTSGTGALSSGSAGSTYNFASGVNSTSTDRAVGFLSSGSYSGTRSLMLKMDNTTGSTITTLNISFDIEKYRTGLSAFNIKFYTSPDGTIWTAAAAGNQSYTSGGANGVVDPPTTITKSFAVSGLSIATASSVYLRWEYSAVSSYSNGQGLGFDNFSVNCCPTYTYYYRSYTTGNYSNPSTWEVSSNGSTWTGTLACSPPTSSATSVTIQSGHTVTVDANSTAPTISINNGGTLQANSTSFVTLTIKGNLVNNGTMQMYDASTYGVNVVFNKSGNQTITGTGSTTNFYSIGVSMGTSYLNILDISSSSFSSYSADKLLINNTGANTLVDGTIKFSGTYTYSNSLFNSSGPTIPSTAGIWLNNSNVSVSAKNYTIENNGYIRVTSGTYNIGTSSGNSLDLNANSYFIVDGGTVNVAARIQAVNSGGTAQNSINYIQSGGTVNLLTVGSTSSARNGLEFDYSTDNFTMSGGAIVFRNQTSSSAVELYNYATSTITGGTIQFGDALSTNITSGGFWISSGSSIPSLVLDNSASLSTIVYLIDNLPVIGSVTINSGTTLNNPDGWDIDLTGDWNNSGTYINYPYGTLAYWGVVIFDGTAAQNMTGTSNTLFADLTIQNSSGGVTLQTPEFVAGVLTLTSGNIYTTTNLLTMNNGSSVTGANNNSFVSGPVAKVGSSAFIFPVGKDSEYRPIADSALSASETFTAEYFHTDPGTLYSNTSLAGTIDHISYCEYWNFNRPTGSSVNAFIQPSWDTYSCGVDDIPNVRIAHWDGTTWNDLGNGGTTGTATSGTVITSAIVSSFSPFTLASHSQNNPLPIELLNFTAKYNGSNAVDLNWTTASETNNDYFTIERSADAASFIEINKTKGAGNSTQALYYSAKDLSPLTGVSYYRLKQTDYNGNYKYSNAVSVNITNNNFEIVNTYSSSAESGTEVTVNCSNNCMLSFELFDITGKIVYTIQQAAISSNGKIIIPTYLFSKGIYLLKAFNGETVISRKIVIQ